MPDYNLPVGEQKNLGFTLMETVVGISIMVIISVLFLANYKYANQQAALTNAARQLASNIRLAQSFTLGSKEFNCAGGLIKVPTGGWGVSFPSPTQDFYEIFADCDGDKINNGPTEVYQTISLTDNIIINSYNPPSAQYNIVFTPPNPVTYINQQLNSSFSIVLKNIITNQTKVIFVNFLGLVDVQ